MLSYRLVLHDLASHPPFRELDEDIREQYPAYFEQLQPLGEELQAQIRNSTSNNNLNANIAKRELSN